MIDRMVRPIVPSLLGHLGLVLTIVADVYRRSSDGAPTLLLAFVCIVALAAAGIFFVRHPRAFFFKLDRSNGDQLTRPTVAARLFAWALVIITPVLWLLMVIELPSVIPSGLAMRLVGAYVFFAWIAAAIMLSPNLFVRSIAK